MTIGLDIAGVVLASIGAAHLAVLAFQEARPGRTSAALLRKLNIEKAIYEQFLNRLLGPYVSPAEIRNYINDEAKSPFDDELLAENMRRTLGDENVALITESLGEMSVLLKALGLELKNMSEGMKALDKIRVKVKVGIASRPMSSVQRNLKQLGEINKELARLVNGSGSIARPRANLRRQIARSRLFLHREYREPAEVYKSICSVFPCDCHEPHIANIGCQCPSCHYPLRQNNVLKDHKWTFQLVLMSTNGGSRDSSPVSENALDSQESLVSPTSPTLPPGHELQRPASVSISLDEPPASLRDSPTEPIADLCAAIRSDPATQGRRDSLGIMGRAKQYELKVLGHDTDDSGAVPIVTLSDLIRIDSQTLTRRHRMQIAFQLCLSVLQLCRTPWVDDGWTWEESCALRLVEEQPLSDSEDPDEDEKTEFPHLFITQKFYSKSQVVPPPSSATRSLQLLADPILAKLGFALIVLALNKTLEEIRQEKGFEYISSAHTEVDDLMTAKQLLKGRRIRHEVGTQYEDVVRACIDGQYVSQEDGEMKVRRNAANFFDVAEEAIMNPLFGSCQLYE